MKNVFSVLFSLIMLMSLLSVGVAVSASTPDAQVIEVYAGETIQIKFSEDNCYSVSGAIEYSNRNLFASLTPGGTTSYGRITESRFVLSSADKVTFEVILTVKIAADAKVGDTCVVSFADCERIENLENFSGRFDYTKTVTVRVKQKPTTTGSTTNPPMSSNADLESLVPSKGSLSPEFAPDITDYSITVPYEVTSLLLSATPDHSAAHISYSGTSTLEVGENIRTIIVTAPNGTTKKYTVVIVRSAAPDTTAATSSASVNGEVSTTTTTTTKASTTTKKTTVATSTTAETVVSTSAVTEATAETTKPVKSNAKQDDKKEDKDTDQNSDMTRLLLIVGVAVVTVGVLGSLIYTWVRKE